MSALAQGRNRSSLAAGMLASLVSDDGFTSFATSPTKPAPIIGVVTILSTAVAYFHLLTKVRLWSPNNRTELASERMQDLSV